MTTFHNNAETICLTGFRFCLFSDLILHKYNTTVVSNTEKRCKVRHKNGQLRV